MSRFVDGAWSRDALASHPRSFTDCPLGHVFRCWALPFSAGCAYPYVAARLAALHVVGEFRDSPDGGTNGVSVGAGPGVAFRLTPTANLDAGVQLSHQRFGSIGTVHFGGSTTYAAKVGITLGLPR